MTKKESRTTRLDIFYGRSELTQHSFAIFTLPEHAQNTKHIEIQEWI